MLRKNEREICKPYFDSIEKAVAQLDKDQGMLAKQLKKNDMLIQMKKALSKKTREALKERAKKIQAEKEFAGKQQREDRLAREAAEKVTLKK